jgi:hypothetical protein
VTTLPQDFFAEDFLRDDFLPDDFLADDFFADFLPADFLLGTLPPDLRASESPIAIACFLLVTFLPEPLFSDPRFRSCIAFSTFSDAFAPYLAITSPKEIAEIQDKQGSFAHAYFRYLG